MDLAGKRVVVVGGTSGIGLAVAAAAAREGAAVVVGSSRQESVDAALGRLDGATGQAVDVGDEGSLERFFDAAGAYNHLVYTAGDWGGGAGRTVAELDLEKAQAGFAVRFWGALATVKYGCRQIAQDGSITLTGGMLAHKSVRRLALATAVTGASEHLARGLAVDLAPVRVNLVCPGLILTERNAQMPPERREAASARLPLPRPGEVDEVAEAYLYCMRAGWTTGQVLRVDGGSSVV